MSLLFLFEDSFQINNFLIFQLILLLGCGFIYFKILSSSRTINRRNTFFLTLIFLISALSSGMQDIVLEVFLIFFVLLGIFFSLKKRWFLTGICLGLAFFSKQYGLLHFLPFYMLLYWQRGNALGDGIRLSGGGILTLAIFLLYFAFLKDISVSSLLNQLSGLEYIEHSSVQIEISRIIIGGKVFLLLFLPALWYLRKCETTPFISFLLTGIVVSLVPVVIKPYDHYYLSSFPYLFLLIAEVQKSRREAGDVLYKIYLATAVIVALLFCARMWRYKENALEQQMTSEILQNHIPNKEEIFVDGDLRFLYLLNRYQNPALKEVGYSYPFKPDEKFAEEYRMISQRFFQESVSDTISIGGRKYFLYNREWE